MSTKKIEIAFARGTLTIQDLDETVQEVLPWFLWDERTKQWRSPAHKYRETILKLRQHNVTYDDQARTYEEADLSPKSPIVPRDHQSAALEAWWKAGRQGTVCLPTGAGKTYLAIMCMMKSQRSTLVIVPTLDLVDQWRQVLQNFFDEPIGELGGGKHDIQKVTVSTYDSAHIHAERIGHMFGLLIFDECHHLPGPQYQTIAKECLAPFRLGLSATLERSDGKQSVIFDLVGPLVYEGDIRGMVGNALSPYDVITLEVPMTESERDDYDQHRQVYTSFLRRERISMGGPNGWMDFVMKSSRSGSGRDAMKSYLRQKSLAQASSNKLIELWKIINSHLHERVLVFTNDNDLAYKIGREFILPVLTHQTAKKERKHMLTSFREGSLNILVTSRVLNEGVDVPEASVGVVVSGTGTVREHVQRLGRILRSKAGKRATLYELVSANTSETYVNQRRREHHAYQRPSEV